MFDGKSQNNKSSSVVLWRFQAVTIADKIKVHGNLVSTNNQHLLQVRYWADSQGFHQEDNLPKVELKPAQETEAVRAARLAHEKAWQEAADAALHPNAQPQ